MRGAIFVPRPSFENGCRGDGPQICLRMKAVQWHTDTLAVFAPPAASTALWRPIGPWRTKKWRRRLTHTSGVRPIRAPGSLPYSPVQSTAQAELRMKGRDNAKRRKGGNQTSTQLLLHSNVQVQSVCMRKHHERHKSPPLYSYRRQFQNVQLSPTRCE